jgi:hypothetical protein
MKSEVEVRKSNNAFSKVKVFEYITFYFAALGIGSSIIASETNYKNNPNDVNKDWVIIMLTIANGSTFFLSMFIYF